MISEINYDHLYSLKDTLVHGYEILSCTNVMYAENDEERDNINKFNLLQSTWIPDDVAYSFNTRLFLQLRMIKS